MTDLSLARHIGALIANGADDLDPVETAEWCEALDSLTAVHGPERTRFVLDVLLAHARWRGVNWLPSMVTPYVNSIALEAQAPFPGDLAMEQRLAALMRGNARAMVMRANRVESGGSNANRRSRIHACPPTIPVSLSFSSTTFRLRMVA